MITLSSIQRALRRLALGGSLGTLLIGGTGCPPPPSICPQCVIKFAETDVPDYVELSRGYKITSATLHAVVRYTEPCPTDCVQEGRRAIAEINGPGHFDDLKLPMKTTDGFYDLEIELELTGSRGKPIVRKVAPARLMDPQPTGEPPGGLVVDPA